MTSLGKAVFWKDKPQIARMLSSWDAERLARVAERTGQLERSLIFSPAPEQAALGEELLAIAREARRR
jgi:DNA polymerase-3 subunit delta